MVFFLIQNNNYNIFNLQLYPTREQQLIFYLYGGGGCTYNYTLLGSNNLSSIYLEKGGMYLQLYPTKEQQLIFYLFGEGGST
jgi:hypothetical protein